MLRHVSILAVILVATSLFALDYVRSGHSYSLWLMIGGIVSFAVNLVGWMASKRPIEGYRATGRNEFEGH